MPTHPYTRLPHTFKICLVLFGILSGAVPLLAQEARPDSAQGTVPNGVRVYLDCDRCDFDHIRREITFVNYVRDPEQADVHLFITDERTGSDGRLYQLSFLGRGRYESVEYTFNQTVDRNATSAEERDAVVAALRLGLVPYAVQTEPLAHFAFQYTGTGLRAETQQPPADPWNHWVFTLYVGDIELELESNRTVFDSRWGVFADHVSEDWKLRLRPYFNYDLVVIEREGEPDIRSSISRHGFDSYAIRSLGPHWSVGLFAEYLTRNDRNIRNQFLVAPGIEYSVLPYAQATRRAVTFKYQIGYTHVDYFEETIFNQTQEARFRHELSATVAIQQPWGEVFGGLEGSHYLHDFSKRRAEFFGLVSVRLFEGLSLRLQAQFDMVQDQLSLPLGNASLEEILLQQRQLATDFELSGAIALTYTFGSRLANIVNTRF